MTKLVAKIKDFFNSLDTKIKGILAVLSVSFFFYLIAFSAVLGWSGFLFVLLVVSVVINVLLLRKKYVSSDPGCTCGESPDVARRSSSGEEELG